MPEAAPPLPATQTPAPQPAPREQQAGASPSIPESSSAQSSASEQTATVQTPAAPSVPTQQQPGTSQGSSAPSGDAAEREAAQPKPSVALLVGPDKIIRVQQALQSRGLYRGPIDGLIGRKTEAALKAFQRNAGLAENGRIDTATLGRLLGGAA
jgi:peptidoglycan hydrolase-like protein with peptidoglycan-binding domain